MTEPLKAYEVLIGVIGMLREKTGKNRLQLKDRSKLYQAVHDICCSSLDKVFEFEFSRRSGQLVSPDIDIILRNLEDSSRLVCYNPDLVDFQGTDVLYNDYDRCVKSRLVEMGLCDHFSNACAHLCA